MLAKISEEFHGLGVLLAEAVDRRSLPPPGRSEELPTGPLFQAFSAPGVASAYFPPVGTPPPESGLGQPGIGVFACFSMFFRGPAATALHQKAAEKR
jgi:hypothetical protein